MKKRFVAENNVEVTDEMLDAWAAPWEAGIVPGDPSGFVAAPGRPRISDEETKIVAFRLPVSLIKAIDRKAERHGETRSQRIREAVLSDLMRA
jgi:hypothetical protein